MQIETYIIVAGLLVGWIATAFFLIKASKKAFARGFDRGVNLAREQRRQLTAFAAKMWLAAYPAPLNAEDAA